MATAIKSGANRLVHDNYTATAVPQVRPLGSLSVYAVVANRSTNPSEQIAVSFDDGANYFTIDSGAFFNFDVWGLDNYMIKSLNGNVSVECLYGLEG